MTWEYLLRMPPQAGAVGVARAAVRAALQAPPLIPLLDDAALITSELVTNAVRHGGAAAADVSLWLRWNGALLEIAVDDHAPGPPRRRTPGHGEAGGRGLLLVDALAHAWGHTGRIGHGKRVWAQLKT